MIQPYLNTIGRYVDFTGRTGRREFWLTWLVHVAILVICILIDVAVLVGAGFPVVLSPIYFVASVIPMLGLGCRRLHDYGHAGWWQYLVLFNPPALLPLMITAVSPSDPFENKYGHPPSVVPSAQRDYRQLPYFGTWLNGLDFHGLSTRREYWTFLLGNIAAVVGSILVALAFERLTPEAGNFVGLVIGVPVTVLVLFSFYPGVSLTVRRMRDAMGSGWVYLVVFVPFVGFLLVYLVFPLLPSRPAPLAYTDDQWSDPGSAVGRAQSWGSDSDGQDPWDQR